ncbi:MAG: recombinase family protein [Bacilli bacterium]|nr:recombinase family protein [Bacilli bacterium]
MIEKVGVYCRLSDEDRDKLNKTDDSDSIINQRSMCLKYANQNGWNVVDIYSDDDFSGAGTYRPDFERLIRDCESGKINLVLCKSQSRFSRDMSVIEEYLHNKFIEWGVRFVSIVDNADTSIEANKKSRQINGLINEWYLDDLSQNIRKSLKNKREDGLFMGSFASYGYDRSEDGHKLVIDPVAAEIVKKIFEMYADGYGYHRICEYLNNNNIPPRSVYKKQKGSKFVCSNCDLKTVRWNPDTIAQMLRNEVYIGNLVQGKSTYVSYKNHKPMKVPEKDWCRIENAHEAIIDMETWNKVQSILGTHYKVTKTGQINYFTRKVYCSCCGKAFMRNVYNVKGEKSGKRAYMQCKGNKKFHICTNNKAIRMDKLEEILLNAINDLLDNYCDKNNLKELYETSNQQNTDNKEIINILNKEKNNLMKKIDDNKSYYRNLYEDKVKGVITEDMFSMMSADYLREIENMTKRIETIDSEISDLEVFKEEKKQADDILKKYKHIKELNKVILDEFIDKVYIGELDKETNTRDIEIEWNFDF